MFRQLLKQNKIMLQDYELDKEDLKFVEVLQFILCNRIFCNYDILSYYFM